MVREAVSLLIFLWTEEAVGWCLQMGCMGMQEGRGEKEGRGGWRRGERNTEGKEERSEERAFCQIWCFLQSRIMVGV